MRLAAPAVPKEWQLERWADGSAHVVFTRKPTGWSAVVLTLLLLWLLLLGATGTWRWPLFWWLIQLAPIAFSLVQLTDHLANRAIGREVWHLTPLGLNVRGVAFGITWRNVDYQRGTLELESGEVPGWILRFHNGANGYVLHQSHDLDEVLGLAAFLEEELGWPLRVPVTSPFLFRQLIEHALARQGRERIRVLVQDERAIPILVRAWKDWDPIFRPKMREILLELERETGCLSHLARQIGSEAQAGAVELLGELGATHACPVLRGALEISTGTVRALAARALGRLRDREAVPALCAALQYAPNLRDAAIQSLGEIRDPEAVPALLELLQGPGQISEIGARLGVIAALGRIKDAAAIPALTSILTGTSVELREAAVHALGEIGGQDVIAPLASVLTDPDARIAIRAAIALGQIREPNALWALAGARAKGHLEVRVRAVRALGDLGDDPAVQALCRALSDPADAVRYEAVSGLIRLASPARSVSVQIRAALPTLRQMVSLLSSERADIRNACREAIQRIELATAKMKHLPLPAAGDIAGAEHLPLPANAHSITSSTAADVQVLRDERR